MEFQHLERLVFYASETVDIPSDISLLKSLKFLWLGGAVRSLPKSILELSLPIYSWTQSKTESGASDSTTEPDSIQKLSKVLGHMTSFAEEVEGPSGRPGQPRELPNTTEVERETFFKTALELHGVYLANIPLEDPPLEIAVKGQDAIASYFRDRSTGDLPLNELKVLLVGHGSAGKTSLVKRLFGEQFDPKEKQTHGISIRPLSLRTDSMKSVKANLWDFGGQEIMHATHQFFLSKRSLYILVLDGRKEEDAEYWLQHIESFGGDSPIIVALNKIDENPSFDANRRFLLNKYPAIVGFFRVSCLSGAGVGKLKQNILQTFERVSILRTPWPRNWFRVKRRLEELDSPYISVSDYVSLCVAESISDTKSQETLVDFLHDLGVILHFRDLQLLDTHVLDPLWVTEGVYRIINSEILATQNGLLYLDQLRHVLKSQNGSTFSYSPQKYSYLIELMLKFELCYKIGDNAILVPDLLNIQEPELAILEDNVLRFVFEYKYLPKSIIPRFMVRMHRDIKGEMRWRTGVGLEDKKFDAVAVVRSDEKASRIHVEVSGKQKRDYFSVIRKVFNDINSSFEKLDVTEYVPLPDAAGILIDYRELLGHELNERDEIFVGRVGKAYSVSMLLNGIEDQDIRLRKAGTIINVGGNYFANPQIGQLMPVGDSGVYQSIDVSGGATNMEYRSQPWERVATFLTAILFVSVVSFLAIRNQPFADRNIVVFVRILLSLTVAIFGATVPGMLRIDIKSGRGILIRATGALALFVLSFWFTPKVL